MRQSQWDRLVEFLATVPEDDEPYTEEQQRQDEAAWERCQAGERGGTLPYILCALGVLRGG